MSSVKTAVGPSQNVKVKWKFHENENIYQCLVVICPEEVGFSVYVDRLPGIVSEGETEEEAVRNIKEAVTAALQVYLEESGSIPWADKDETVEGPKGAKKRWILVNV